MDKSIDLRKGRSCVFLMHVHLIFVTKYRRHVFSKQILDELRAIFTNVCSDFESQLVEFEGGEDYVHLLINYPTKVTISKLVNSLKGVSSRLIRKKSYPSIKHALCKGSLWSPSYFARSCGAPLEVVRHYSEQQKTPEHPWARFLSDLKSRNFSCPPR